MINGTASRGHTPQVLREPFVHFILIGACLFWLFSWLSPDDEKSSRQILITQDRLLEFMQYRNQTFSDSAQEQLNEILQSMTADQKAALIDDYVREEVLYREAVAIGLDNSDYVIRRRLAQTMEYVLRGAPDEDFASPDDNELKKFFLTNLERYENPARVSARHVFFSITHDEQKARGRANDTLAALRAESIGFEEALARSDRFPYFNDYVDETQQLIESHLGAEIAKVAFEKLPISSWQGPYRSPRGLHLIQVNRRTAPKKPDFESIRQIVVSDWRNAKTEEILEQRVRGLIDSYRLESAAQ